MTMTHPDDSYTDLPWTVTLRFPSGADQTIRFAMLRYAQTFADNAWRNGARVVSHNLPATSVVNHVGVN